MHEDEYHMNDFDWRKLAGNNEVLLSNGMVVLEREVYLAVEKLTAHLQETENRFPTEEDIETFILMLRGPE